MDRRRFLRNMAGVGAALAMAINTPSDRSKSLESLLNPSIECPQKANNFDQFAGTLAEYIKIRNSFFFAKNYENSVDPPLEKNYSNALTLVERSMNRFCPEDQKKLSALISAINMENQIAPEDIRATNDFFQQNGYVFYIADKPVFSQEGSVYSFEFGRITDRGSGNHKRKGITKEKYTDYGMNENYELILFEPLAPTFEDAAFGSKNIMFAPQKELEIRKVYVNVNDVEQEAKKLWKLCNGSAEGSPMPLHVLFMKKYEELLKQSKERKGFLTSSKRAFMEEFENYLIETFAEHHEPYHLFFGPDETKANIATLENYPDPYVLAKVLVIDDNFESLVRKNGYSFDDIKYFSPEQISEMIKVIKESAGN
jgi:hypothetical protein